jgi:two-component system sensor histidine kinase TctE
MPSLRAQLAFWLLAPLLAVAAFNAWLTYENALESTNRAHDRTLLGSVLAIAERISVVDDEVVVDIPYSSLEMLESSLQGRVYYRVSLGAVRHLTGYEDLKPPSVRLELGKPTSTTASISGSACVSPRSPSGSTSPRSSSPS